MKNEDTIQKLHKSSEYRSMFREIIRTQIQTLIDHLAIAGEESVLLTACKNENDVTENTVIVGTELGQDFLAQENVQCKFKEFCQQKKQGTKDILNFPGKRKFNEINDAAQDENAEQVTPKMESKRSRPMTPSLKQVKTEDTSSPAAARMHVPKGYSKCNLCNYMSKFKANVTRHERSVHKINVEGSTLVTSQYMCALCEYRSTYRANLVRHERSVHKITSSNADIESRKIQVVQNGDGSPFTEADINNFEKEAGNQLFMNQTGSVIENIGNQSIDKTGGGDLSISQIKQDFNVQIENQTNSCDVNQSYINENGSHSEFFENQSNIESSADIDGCHICNYCQLLFNSKENLMEHVENAHLKPDLMDCERKFESESGLQTNTVTQNAPKQEVCKCGKAFQYRASLIRHERKCEISSFSQGNSSQEEQSEISKIDTVKIEDQIDSIPTENENGDIQKVEI